MKLYTLNHHKLCPHTSIIINKRNCYKIAYWIINIRTNGKSSHLWHAVSNKNSSSTAGDGKRFVSWHRSEGWLRHLVLWYCAVQAWHIWCCSIYVKYCATHSNTWSVLWHAVPHAAMLSLYCGTQCDTRQRLVCIVAYCAIHCNTWSVLWHTVLHSPTLVRYCGIQ